ncbi:MAG TPA: helix-turn-helix domain-containing protein [Leeuwenhoekiella sp.]|nr:helix-turn-helix domain-containing protein [Leeuwenhoekiella sp.]
MKNSGEDIRYENLRNMILELAIGNFAHRFQPEGYQDHIEKLGLMLNLLAEELSGFFIHPGSFGLKELADPYVFMMDSELKISGVNRRFTDLLKYSRSDLIGNPITDFMTEQTIDYLTDHLKAHSKTQQTFSPIRLLISFISNYGNIMECWGYCHLLQSANGMYYFFRGLPIIEKNDPIDPSKNIDQNSDITDASSFRTLQFQADILRVRKVHQYILLNLHQSLPPIPVMARQFNLNEFKLKKGFKELYNTTIFKFHLERRLEMAKVMIKNTPASLKIVAKKYGFRNYSHFSKVFKTKHGKKPSYYKKKRN